MDNVVDKCLDLDMYGRRIWLTYRGHDKFRTHFGAFCTILVGLFVISYAAFRVQLLVDPEFVMHVESKISSANLYEIYD